MAIKPIKVSQLNGYIDRILKNDPLLGSVTVTGEVSNLKYHSSGHVYFSLKDEHSTLRCFLAASMVPRVRYELTDGMELIVSGSVTVYRAGGIYSLQVTGVEVAGQGELAAAFEALKRKLQAEGLFDASQKKPIPAFPRCVAVVTSETGAAIRDILKIITSRNHVTNVLIVPVTVQGPKAAPEICHALQMLNMEHPEVDTILLGRGGGSAEDLWAFNEESVARAISQSVIPIISAVGHETDVSISDFVADYRAETPTAAAVAAVPDTNVLNQQLNDWKQSMDTGVLHRWEQAQHQLHQLRIKRLTSMLQQRIALAELQLHHTGETISFEVQRRLQESTVRLQMEQTRLEGASPQRLMQRGYVALTDENGIFLHGVQTLKPQEQIRLTAADGTALARIEQIEERQSK